jgi:dienelactone hydrolase
MRLPPKSDRQSRTAPDKENEVPGRVMVYSGAYHAFDVPLLRNGRQFLEHRLEYNEDAFGRSVEEVRSFLRETLGG